MSVLDEDFRRRVEAYKAELQRMGRDGRRDFVDIARRNEDWPEPRVTYLASHARKWGRGLLGPEYAQRAYEVKNRAGVVVLAYVHPIERNRGLAFIDHDLDFVVVFDCDQSLNFDLFSPTNGTRTWVKDKTARGTHWRLKDTEL